MEKAATNWNRLEHFTSNWNAEFPDYKLSVDDLKKPHSLMGALFQVFERLGIDNDNILAPPPKEVQNEHLIYYMDLLPVINMTRVVNHLMAYMPSMPATYTITQFLQPMTNTSHSLLLVLLNFTTFHENRLSDIQPHELELFSKTDQVKSLEDKYNNLLVMLNEQAIEKGERADRLKQLDQRIKELEEELNVEKEAHDEEQKELEAVLKENKQLDLALAQKKSHRDGLMAEIEQTQALRVYDADDTKAQAEQATKNVQDAEEKLKSLQETLIKKENSLKNLQTIKPNLDAANNLLHDIMKLCESLRDFENGDLDTDSSEGELNVLNTEIGELTVQLAELKAARAEAAQKRQETNAKRQEKRTMAESNLREMEEKNKKCIEQCKKLAQRTQEIKELTVQYEKEKADYIDELSNIENEFKNELKSMDETLLKKLVDAKKKIEDKLKQRCV